MPKKPLWRTLIWAIGPIVLAIGVIVFIVDHYSEPSGSSSNKPLPAMQPANAPAANVVNPKAFDQQAREVAGKFLLTAVSRRNTGASWELLDPTFPGKEGYTKATWAKGDIPVIPFPAASSDAPLNVAAKFIDTAVARRNVAESWNILSPTFEGRGEYTKRTWAKGDIPVQSFPVSKAKWDLEHSFRNEVGLLVALFPPKGSDYRATVFKIDLRAFGKGAHRRWLVDYFGPVGTDNISVPSGGAAPRTGGLPDLNPQGRTGPSGRLNRAWLAVPIGILGMAVLFPIGFAVANVYRGRRAERNFAKTGSA